MTTHIKPQAALISTSRTQIGSQAQLRLGVGIGFRLSDPRVLAHEASVWEAIKAAAPSVPLFEPGMPKQHAEWLLLGHAHYRGGREPEGSVNWSASAELGKVGKRLSCHAAGQLGADGCLRASLELDHRQAAAGHDGANPCGLPSHTPPLQLLCGLGAKPAALAALGPLGLDWPERRQWQPARPRSIAAMAEDGTHLGWPAATDLRIFQQAAPDQWSRERVWRSGECFALRGMGPAGQGFAGKLPALTAVALAGRHAGALSEQAELALQTVWFLPDWDLGVMWWNGFLPLDYPLQEDISQLLVALKDCAEPLDLAGLKAFAWRRADVADQDPMLLSDHPLMPDPGRGWVWEQILAVEDHPGQTPAPLSHEQIGDRMRQQWQAFEQAQRDQIKLRAFARDSEKCLATTPTAASSRIDWRQRLEQDEAGELCEQTLSGVDLSGLDFEQRHWRQMRFEQCRFDLCSWRQCRFEQVSFVDCSFTGARLEQVSWTDGGAQRCKLERSAWHEAVLQRVNLEDCRLDGVVFIGGSWQAVTVQGQGGDQGRVAQMRWDRVSFYQVTGENWRVEEVRADGLDLVRSALRGAHWRHCQLLKFSALESDLSASLWQRCGLTLAVISYHSSLKQALLEDCELTKCCWQALQADGVHLEYCTCLHFCIGKLQAPGSRWNGCVLDGAKAVNANLAGAVFQACSLRDVALQGADLSESRLEDCNLIDANTAWILPAAAGGWQGNLDAGLQDLPRRSA